MYECEVQAKQLEKYFGKYPGLVKDNTAPDGQPHLGELLVEVSGILEEGSNGQGLQPIQVRAKPCFVPGFFFIPDVGAPVWVEFIAGDINQPLWTGVWYPTKKIPQTVDGKSPTEFQKIIRTREASGQVIQLDDTNKSEKLVIADETNGNTVIMDANGMTIEDGNGNIVTMDANGVQIVDGNGNSITMRSTGGTTDKSISLNGTIQVVLAPLIDWLLNHRHVGNMGSPTPLFPADIIDLQTQSAPGGGLLSDEIMVK